MAEDVKHLELDFARSPNVTRCLQLANAYVSDRRYVEALVVCKKGARVTPADPRAACMQIHIHMAQNKLDKAARDVDELLAKFPQSPLVLETAGRVCMLSGQPERAIESFLAAVALDDGRKKAKQWLEELGHHQKPPVPADAASQVDASPQRPPPPPKAILEQDLPAELSSEIDTYFAPESLGFQTDGVGIQTAGPGRLTIVGFIPKVTGSIWSTVIISVAGFVICALTGFLSYRNAGVQRRVHELASQVRSHVEADQLDHYVQATEIGAEVVTLDPGSLAAYMTLYSHTVLGTDFGMPEHLERAQKLLAELDDEERSEHWAAAATRLSIEAGDFAGAAEIIAEITAEGRRFPLLQMEQHRLFLAQKNTEGVENLDPELRVAAGSQVRVLDYLGWQYYLEGKMQDAQRMFAMAIQLSRSTHQMAKLGKALVALDSDVGLDTNAPHVAHMLSELRADTLLGASPEARMAIAFGHGILALWQGTFAVARTELDAAKGLLESDKRFAYREALAWARAGRLEDAQKQMEALVQADATASVYSQRLSRLCLLRADYTCAERAAQNAEKQGLDAVDATLLRGEILTAQKRHQEALALYADRLGDNLPLPRRGESPELASGDPSTSLRVSGAGESPLVKDESARVRLRSAQARAMAQLGKRMDAIKLLETLAEKATDANATAQADLREALGFLYEGAVAYKRAVSNYELCTEQDADRTECHFGLCRLGGAAYGTACASYVNLAPRGRFVAEAKRRMPR